MSSQYWIYIAKLGIGLGQVGSGICRLQEFKFILLGSSVSSTSLAQRGPSRLGLRVLSSCSNTGAWRVVKYAHSVENVNVVAMGVAAAQSRALAGIGTF
jgi:predicted amidohydrolase